MDSPTPSIGSFSIDAYVQAANPKSFPTVLVIFDEHESENYTSQEFFHHLATEVIANRITPSRLYLTLSNKKVNCIFLGEDISYDVSGKVLVTQTEDNVNNLRGYTWQIAVEETTLHSRESILIEGLLNTALKWKKTMIDSQYADECEKKSGNSIKWLIIALCVCITAMKLKSSWSPKNLSKYKNIKRARGI